MKVPNITCLTLALAAASCIALPTSAGETPQSEAFTVTYALDLRSDGSVLRLEPKSAIPADVRAALAPVISRWSFQPTPAGSRPRDTSTFLRISLKTGVGVNKLQVLSATTGPAPQSLHLPQYPRSAQLRGQQGVVVLKLRLRSDGSVEDVALYGGAPKAPAQLVDAAFVAARDWTFVPEKVDGRAVASTVLMPVCFMTAEAATRTCDWEGPAGQRFGSKALLALEPVVQLNTSVAFQGN